MKSVGMARSGIGRSSPARAAAKCVQALADIVSARSSSDYAAAEQLAHTRLVTRYAVALFLTTASNVGVALRDANSTFFR